MNTAASSGLRSQSVGSKQPPNDLFAARRPQSLMLNFLGIYYRQRTHAIYAGSIIDVFDRLGEQEYAVRSALGRMVRHGLLEKHRDGRRVYFAPTERAAAILEDGHRRIWETGALSPSWDGTWTLVAFSLPDSRRDVRHHLRQELLWAGFGPLQHGLWAHPGPRDVMAIVENLALHDHVHVMTAQAQDPTSAQQMVSVAFDLEGIAKRYREFLSLWSGAAVPTGTDALVRQIFLHTDWLTLIRYDPGLPPGLMPQDWPVMSAERTFRDLATRLAAPAAAIVNELVEERPIPSSS